MNLNMTFSEAACHYIKQRMEKEKGIGFRLSIKKTGCSGYAYQPAIVDTVLAEDMAIEIANGLQIYVDPAWVSLLEGLHVDYIEEDKMGLKQKN